MSLHLYYVDSVSPYLKEILGDLVQRHFSFKLQDSFRILVPNRAAKVDIENQLLEFEQLQGVLIGKSVLQLQELYDQILLYNPNVKPTPPIFFERQLLRQILSNTHGIEKHHSLDYHLLVREIKRLQFLMSFSTPSPHTRLHPILKKYENALRQQDQYWCHAQKSIEVANIIGNKQCREFAKISQIYILGFYYPLPDMVYFLELLHQAYPTIDCHFFLPSPQKSMDQDGLLTSTWERLEKLAELRTHYRDVPQAPLEMNQFPTPFHQAQWVEEKLRESSLKILTPNFGPTQNILGKNFHPEVQLNLETTQVPDLLIEELKQSPLATKGTLLFSEIFHKITELIIKLRQKFSLENNLISLKHLEECFRVLKEIDEIETPSHKRLPSDSWFALIEEEFSYLAKNRLSSDDSLWRNLHTPGLEHQDEIIVLDLNEKIINTSNHSLLFGSYQDNFRHHETKLALDQTHFLASQKIHYCLNQFDMEGNPLEPSYLIDLDSAKIKKVNSELKIVLNNTHPFYAENVQREKHRAVEKKLTIDNGALQTILMQKNLLSQIHKRPLSASYLEDYAKCPWRFFAHWQLHLEKAHESELEFDPRVRGSLLHELLEKIFIKLQQNYFLLGKIPELKILNEIAESEWKKISNNSEKTNLSPIIFESEMKQLLSQIQQLLEKEQIHWNHAKKRLIPRFFEWNFGRSGQEPYYLKVHSDLEIPISGAIDRIDVSEDGQEFLVIDYKSSGTAELSKKIRDRRSFQLFLYIAVVEKKLFQNAQGIGGLYWDLKEMKKNQGLVQKEKYKNYTTDICRGSSFYEKDDFNKSSNEIEAFLKNLVKEILKGNFSLTPKECEGTFCPYHQICRYEESFEQ